MITHYTVFEPPPGTTYQIAVGDWVGEWVATQIGGVYEATRSTAIGLLCGEELVAGVIYEKFTDCAFVCHVWADHMTPKFLATIFDYPFNQAKMETLIAPIAQSNRQSIRLVSRMGFTLQAKLKKAHPTGNMLIYQMLKKDCRFLAEKYQKKLQENNSGQIITPAPTSA